ncbi:aminoglycoside phosphotransferase family protein [Kitasatospora sp. NPDC085895]|uniref:aminoglycoside phosphotransferase family protein n=1 Tax=Kitasatospora sp. NPDC085895 TaxID=3155057 RepID=UPI00344C4ABA
MIRPALPDAADRLLHETAGPYVVLGAHSRDRAGLPTVWEVRTGDGRRLFAKQLKNELMHRRETAAHRGLVPALGPGRAPVLLAEDTRSRLVVTTALPGTPAVKAALGPAEEREVYRQAGLLAARIHAHPAIGGVVGERLPWGRERERALDRAREARLPAEDIEVLAEATRVEPPHTSPAACHGDFGPRNWLVHREDGGRLTVGVVDFERSQVKEPVRRDLMRVVFQLTPRRPDLRAASRSPRGVPRRLRARADARGVGGVPGLGGDRLPRRLALGPRPPPRRGDPGLRPHRSGPAAPSRACRPKPPVRRTSLEVAPWRAFAKRWP